MHIDDLPKLVELEEYAKRLKELCNTIAVKVFPDGGFSRRSTLDFWVNKNPLIEDLKMAFSKEYDRVLDEIKAMGVKVDEDE